MTSRSSASSGTVATCSPGRPEALQHDDGRRRIEALEQLQLHVRQDERAVALGDQQRSVARRRVDREVAPVDHPGAVERVDTEARPGELRERQPGNDHDFERVAPVDAAGASTLMEERDRALRDDRAPRHRVHDLAVARRELGEARDDPGVDRRRGRAPAS